MSQVLVTEQYLEDIADSIRTKNGSGNTYTPAQMANAIGSLYPEPSGSITITQNGTYNIKDKESIIINVPSGGTTPSSNDLLFHFNDFKNDGSLNLAFHDRTGYSITDEQSKFGGTCLKINNSVSVSYSAILFDTGFTIGDDDFTLDFWMYPVEVGENACPFAFKYRSLAYYMTSNNKRVASFSSTGSSWASPGLENRSAMSFNSWHHVAIVRNNNTINEFLDGILEKSHSFNGSIAAMDTLSFGTNAVDTRRWHGYIDEFRLKIGEAVWTGNFTPPTQPYT